MLSRHRPASLVLLTLVLAVPVGAGSVRNSKHDISTPGAGYSDQTCAFCHTPHSSNRVLGAPLWNRFVDRTKAFTPYASVTMNTVPGNPNDSLASVLCLGCHDGTIGYAVVNTYTGSDKHDLVNAPGPGGIPDTSSWPNCERCHPEMYGKPAVEWTGTDLGNDHPISMRYPTIAEDAAFHTPPDANRGWPDVPLFDGKIECATCHQPHDPDIVPFLRTSNVGSQLCLNCHVK